MVILDIQQDELFKESVDRFISGMLPHENFKSNLYCETFRLLTSIVHTDEIYGEYYILIECLRSLKDIKSSIKDYEPRLTEETLTATLVANLADLVRDPQVRIYDILERYGYETNLDVENNFTKALNLMYTRVVELYKECYELKISSEDAISYFPALKSSFINHVAQSCIRSQVNIVKSSEKVGRKIMSGANDWLEYIGQIQSYLKTRLDEDDGGIFRLDSMEKSNELLERAQAANIPLADYGIPPIDDKTPMLRHRLVVIVAGENTGKTMIMINSVVRLLMNSRKAIVMCGETTEEAIQSMVLSNYIYQKYQMHVTPTDVDNLDTLPEDIRRLINVARAEVVEAGLLRLVGAFSYDNFYEELESEYNKEPFDAVFIDHSCTLKGKGSENENVTALAKQSRQFKKDYPVFIGILSQLSTTAAEDLAKGKRVMRSPTRGSAALSHEADDLFIFSSNEALAKQGLLQMENYKRRKAEKVLEYIIIKKKFSVCNFYWDAKLQNSGIVEEVALDKVKEIYDEFDDEDEDDEYDDID